jgi:hypothetical protein
MNWNWLWVVGIIFVIYIIWKLSQSNTSTSRTSNYRASYGYSNSTLNDTQAAAVVQALVDGFSEIISRFLGGHYTSSDIRKIAIGMVAVMANENITLDQLKYNNNLVVEVAAKSAAYLTARGEIGSYR